MTDFKAVTVNLGNQEIEIVQEFAAMIYEGKFSPALRQIIREWARTSTTNGKVITIGGASQPEK